MSQNIESPSVSATLDEYHQLMAAGHFRPATSISLVPSALRTKAPVTPAAAPVAPPAPSMLPTAPHIPPRTAPASPASTYASNVPSRATTASPASSYSPYATAPSTPRMAHTDHLPNLMPRPVPTYGPFPGYAPMQYSPPPPPDSITRDMIVTRIQTLLQSKLPQWGIPHIVMLSSNLADRVISLGQDGHLGSEGISSVDDIFIVVGHEGVGRYMALAVVAPVALNILLRGQTWNTKGLDPMRDSVAMELVRMGFHNLASDQWTRLNDEMRRGSRR